MLFGIFGLAPIISRTNDLLPLFKNGLAFTAAGIGGYILSQTLFSRYEKPKKYLKYEQKISNPKKIHLLHEFHQTLNTIDEKHALIPYFQTQSMKS